MEGVRWPLGVLPLEFAIVRGWSEVVVRALLKAFPAAAMTLDPVFVKTSKANPFDPKKWKPDSSKGCRWMRKIAMDFYESSGTAATAATAAVLRLLPQPSAKKPLLWTDGAKVAEEEAEKQRQKDDRAARKRAQAEKLAASKAFKAAARAAKAPADRPRSTKAKEQTQPEFEKGVTLGVIAVEDGNECPVRTPVKGMRARRMAAAQTSSDFIAGAVSLTPLNAQIPVGE